MKRFQIIQKCIDIPGFLEVTKTIGSKMYSNKQIATKELWRLRNKGYHNVFIKEIRLGK